ncbi:hypothetical protein [Brevibacillus aydinogluensis]|jgi:hypothetical protein|uniref:hypothetical protein n=1 Tax=Brevibacillus aydinogluensis TaxID=927786 RepID=UPI0026F3F860|nr:hypothetical protein [Brevibacillus aydinogluensis]
MSITKRADNFYQELVLHLKTPEKITMLWVLLFVYKCFFPTHAEKLFSILKNSIPHLAYVVEMLMIFAFILSILALLAMLLIMLYKPIANLKYARISKAEDLKFASLYIENYYRLLYGARHKVLMAATWCIWQTKCAEFGNVKMPN